MSVALALLLPSSGPLAAEEVKDKGNHYQLRGSGWTTTQLSPGEDAGDERLLLTATHDSGEARAALIRIDYPNTPAWRNRKHYFADVERGLREATDGFSLESKKQTKIGRVPVLDIRYRRKHASAPHVSVRFVFFRTFTLIVSAQSSKRHRRAAIRLARSLKPLF